MRLRRILGVSALVLAALLAVPLLGVGGFMLWLRHEVAAYEGTAAIPGLSAPVEILRDRDGVPHIFAETEADGAAALGWAHAQDRLWQMETMRRLGAGRLSEVMGTRFGDFALRVDRSMRTLGLMRRAEAAVLALSPETRATMEAYARGVNAYLENRAEALPVEFQILGVEPEPWRVADSMVWGQLMAMLLSANQRDELLRARLLRALPAERVEELFPAPAGGSPVTVAATAALRDMDLDMDVDTALDVLEGLGPNTASNQWVLSGRATDTGKPILANDPHLRMQAPIQWHLARIVTPERTLAGVTSPGVPFIVMGHNGRVAWGVTTTGGDTQDLFIEKVDPEDPGRYLTPDGYTLFDQRAEVIRIAGREPETLTVRETRHGPVITGVDPKADVAGPGHVLALAFAGFAQVDTTAEALARLNRARSAEEVKEALRLYRAPQQNIVYADVDGRIGFLAPAAVPIRRAGNGLTPVPGWDDSHAWTGFIPFEELPRIDDPQADRIVNANNAVVGPDYPHLIAAEWQNPARARRVEQLVAAPKQTVDQQARHLADSVSLFARDLLPLLLKTPPEGRLVPDALGQLRGWDGAMRHDRPEPLVYYAWLRELTRMVFADELGAAFEDYWEQAPEAIPHVFANAPHWCDDVTTEGSETCPEMRARSLRAALDRLEERHGPHLVTWRWGAEHKATLNHQILGRVPLLGRLFDLSAPTDGGHYTVNRGGVSLKDERAPFAHVHGAGYRGVYDLSNLDNSRATRSRRTGATSWSGGGPGPW